VAQFIENAPVASDFMETARSFGNYDLALSLADLLDNSISAGASKISIKVIFDGPNSTLKILDNGKGMSRPELFDAMRMASRNPKLERSQNDLGRFGLGLKTASFAQASCLTVCTKTVDAVVKRYAKLRRLYPDLQGSVFQSTRKWFITQCERTGTPEHFTASLVGHDSARSANKLTYGLYSAGISDAQKRGILDGIKLPDLSKEWEGNA